MGLPEALFPIELVERTVRRVGPGSVHVPDALTLEQQRRLVAGARDWPGKEITARGATSRRHVTVLPTWVVELGRAVLDRAWCTGRPDVSERSDRTPDRGSPDGGGPDDGDANDWRPDDREPNDWEPASALVTHLAPGSGLRMHRIAGGSAPVVVLSIGDACRFRLGNPRSAARPHRDVLLESGDALVYGGPAGGSFVGVPEIRPGTAPEWCGLVEGRLGIALTTSE